VKNVTVIDILIIALAILITVASLFLISSLKGNPLVTVSSTNNKWAYDINVDRVETFSGPVGNTTVEIKDGFVRVVSSDCLNKVCISAGKISKVGQWIICLPNDVFVLIEGSIDSGGEVDDIAF
jgi:hypothetical protein